MATLLEKIEQRWEAFCAFSHDDRNTDQEVIAEEAVCDDDIGDLLAEGFSHPPSKPNRRR